MRNQLHIIMDYLKQIGLAGLNSRIKRLSDDLLYSTRKYYKQQGLDIEPNWHLVFLLLEERNSITISDLSQELRMSHPACVKIINKMKKLGYLKTQVDQEDSRKQLLFLSEKSLKQMNEFHKHWEAGIKTTEEMIRNSPNFLKDLSEIEKLIEKSDYLTRTTNNYNKL